MPYRKPKMRSNSVHQASMFDNKSISKGRKHSSNASGARFVSVTAGTKEKFYFCRRFGYNEKQRLPAEKGAQAYKNLRQQSKENHKHETYFFDCAGQFWHWGRADAASFGDAGTNTLAAITGHPNFQGENLAGLGLFNIDGVNCRTPGRTPGWVLCAAAGSQRRQRYHDWTLGNRRPAFTQSIADIPRRFPAGAAGCFYGKDRLSVFVQQALLGYPGHP